MKALVTVSSKHGSTTEIGQAIAAELQAKGMDVDVVEPQDVKSIAEYDAIIVGSALYMGRWMGPARDFIHEHVDELRKLPVWLFASGPVTPVTDDADAVEGRKLLELVGGREARVFAGKLQKDGLGFTERTVVRMIKSPWGDYRPWDSIFAWADSISESLVAVPVGG